MYVYSMYTTIYASLHYIGYHTYYIDYIQYSSTHDDHHSFFFNLWSCPLCSELFAGGRSDDRSRSAPVAAGRWTTAGGHHRYVPLKMRWMVCRGSCVQIYQIYLYIYYLSLSLYININNYKYWYLYRHQYYTNYI